MRACQWWASSSVAAPLALTAILLRLQIGQSRDYIFVYLAVVGLLGKLSRPSMVSTEVLGSLIS